MYSVQISHVGLPDSAVELPAVSGPSMYAGTLTITGWPVIACGVALAVAGGAVASAFQGAPNVFGAPAWLIPPAGLLFSALGLYITVDGLSGLLQQRTTDERAKAMPDRPWLWDHKWSEDGIGGDTGSEVVKAFGFALIALVVVLPLHWVFFVIKEIPWVFGFGLVMADVIIVAAFVRVVQLVRMARRYGPSWLRFRRFPFRTGEKLEATLDATSSMSDLPSVNATLRCIQERYEIRRLNTTNDKQFQVVRYSLWSASARVDRSAKGTFDFEFEIPADAPGSALREQPSRYWELIVASDDVPGVDYHARFLVPVYRGRQGAQGARVH